ncbi:hypothetical protein QE152_g4479 [Popillia japonica]|uniref:Uncharacterized protein n=1 Tax=Popillia japonica TaxID=7064 RepID=A0AAW1MUE3_POPJA
MKVSSICSGKGVRCSDEKTENTFQETETAVDGTVWSKFDEEKLWPEKSSSKSYDLFVLTKEPKDVNAYKQMNLPWFRKYRTSSDATNSELSFEDEADYIYTETSDDSDEESVNNDENESLINMLGKRCTVL